MKAFKNTYDTYTLLKLAGLTCRIYSQTLIDLPGISQESLVGAWERVRKPGSHWEAEAKRS